MDPPPPVEPERLPEYAESTVKAPVRQPTRHFYELDNRHGHAWLTLEFATRAKTDAHMPRVLEGDRLSGTVEMHLKSATYIRSVSIAITGELIGKVDITFPFLEVSQDLWVDTSPPSKSAFGLLSKREKLKGSFSWPFSLQMPRTVTQEHEEKQYEFRLPASFHTRFSKCTVLYKLTVTVVHGKFTPKHELGANLLYLPIVTPDAYSPSRLLAYQEQTTLLGPDKDPGGWHSIPTITIPGTIFDDRPVEVKVTLSLAKPLCYTRGTLIPVMIMIECDDAQALHVLSTPEAFPVRLRRTISYAHRPGGSVNYETKDFVNNIFAPNSMYAIAEITEHMADATCWRYPPDLQNPSETKRVFEGEITLPAASSPSGRLVRYKLVNDVALYYPLDIAAFVPTAVKLREVKVPELEPIAVVPIEVATAYPPGPRPVAYTPPNYSASEERDATCAPFQSAVTQALEQPRIAASAGFM